MPGSLYRITQSSQSGLTSLPCYACRVDVRFLTHQVGSYTASREPELVCKKYGEVTAHSETVPVAGKRRYRKVAGCAAVVRVGDDPLDSW